MLASSQLVRAVVGGFGIAGCAHGFAFPHTAASPPASTGSTRVVMGALPGRQVDAGGGPNNVRLDEHGKLVVNAHFVADDEDRIKALEKDLVSTSGDQVAVRLLPKAASKEGEKDEQGRVEEADTSLNRRPANTSDDGERGGTTSGDGGVLHKGCLPAFRFEREGLAFDEYHTHGDVPYEAELAKRVKAALSLAHPEDAATLKELWSPDAAGGNYRDEMAVATYLVQVASHVARELQEELCKSEAISKTDSSPVTVADFTVQAIVLGVLSRYFPEHGFIAEETSCVLRQDPAALSRVLSVVSTVLGQHGLTEAELCAAIDLGAKGHGKHEMGHWHKGGRTWVLDPIDGTKGFLRGEQFCVALGLLDRGKAVAGVLGCPNLPAGYEHPSHDSSGWAKAGEARGLLYTAASGEGTFVRAISAGADDSRRVFVDHARKPHETRVLESVEAGHTSHNVAAQVCSDLGITLPPIRVDGQCKYGLLSEGQGGIYLRLPKWGYVENIWDHVAGAVVIREAGGKVTDTRGEPLDFSLGPKLPREVVGVVATCGRIHADVLRAVDNRQLEDWARVVADANAKGWEGGSAAPPLPGVDWAPLNDGRSSGVGEAWQATALSQRRPLVMRTSEQFYGTLERNWHKLVAVLFHGGTNYSQHAVSIIESLASQQHYPTPESHAGEQLGPRQAGEQQEHQGERRHPGSSLAGGPPPLSTSSSSLSASSTAATQTAPVQQSTSTSTGSRGREVGEKQDDGCPVLLAEANVMSLIDVADRQAIAGLPSLHLHLGGREILRIPVNSDDSVESLGRLVNDMADKVCQAAWAS